MKASPFLRLVTAALAASATLALAGSALAVEYTAYNVVGAQAGSQDWKGPLGHDFDVVNGINVYALGVFDDNSDGLKRDLQASIYDRDTKKLVARIAFPIGSGKLIGGSRFIDLPCPLTLPAGFHGVMVAEGYGAEERNGNGGPWTSDDGNGALKFLGGGRYGAAFDTFPENVDGGPTNRYAAGTFVFAEACLDDGSCSNAARSKCGAGGGAFFPACVGATASCNTVTATCVACDGNKGAGGAKAQCYGPQAPACNAGACTECGANVTCSASAQKPVCAVNNACAACGSDNGGAANACPSAANPYCKADGACGKCTADADCATRVGKPYCAADGSCSDKCATDAQCGNATSGKICDANKTCSTGCRGTGGNGCAAGQVCSSKDGTAGTCSTVVTDAGVDGATSSSSSSSSSSSGSTSSSSSSSGGASSSGAASSSSGAASSSSSSGTTSSGASTSTPNAGGDDSGCAVTSNANGTTGAGAVLLGLALVASVLRRRRKD
jgi:MYXO-CTERM domain-containing protein